MTLLVLVITPALGSPQCCGQKMLCAPEAKHLFRCRDAIWLISPPHLGLHRDKGGRPRGLLPGPGPQAPGALAGGQCRPGGSGRPQLSAGHNTAARPERPGPSITRALGLHSFPAGPDASRPRAGSLGDPLPHSRAICQLLGELCFPS